jgi:hypothetical protein
VKNDKGRIFGKNDRRRNNRGTNNGRGDIRGKNNRKGVIEGVIIVTGTLREIKPFKHGQIPVLQWLGQTERQTMKGV